MQKRIVTFPHMGNYYIAEKTIARLFGDEVLPPPPITKRTLELGAKYSPESVCIPFKYTLGNFIEALESGANFILQAGAGCRMGMYGEVQKTILRKLGYHFEFVKMTNDSNVISIARYIKRLNPHLSYWRIAKALYLAYRQAEAIEHMETIVRENIGFEAQPGSFERSFKAFLFALDRNTSIGEIARLEAKYEAAFRSIEVHKPDNSIRVGVIGEIYVVAEPFSNFFLEKELAHYGIEVCRYVTITDFVRRGLNYQKYVRETTSTTKPYLYNDLGGDGTASVATALKLAQQGYDGLIHVKPFGCMPEVDAMPALFNISKNYQIPILYFSFDTLTSEVGIKTRLEAFYDMLVMKGNHDVVPG